MRGLAGAAFALLLVTCSSAPDGAAKPDAGGTDAPRSDAGGGSVTFANLLAVVRVRCHPCHTVDGLGGLMEFGLMSPADDAKAYATLVSPAKGSLCADMDLNRVVPGDPAHSLVITKLEARVNNVDPLCGGSMPPLTEPNLPAADIDLIRRWILGGAPGPK